MKGLIVYVVVLVLVISFSLFLGYKTWTLGNNEKDYEIVCLGGHEYYRANFLAKGMLAVRIDDDGNPIKCSR